jgi:hypothetical protein
VLPGEPTDNAGRLLVWRDNKMCGKTEHELWEGQCSWPTSAATGSFHISEIERDSFGDVTGTQRRTR